MNPPTAPPGSPDDAPSATPPIDENVRWVEVAVPVAQVDGALTYKVPGALNARAVLGALAQVHVGRQRLVGVIVRVGAGEHGSAYEGKLRFLDAIVSDGPVVTEPQLALVQFVSRYYLAPIGEAVRLALPPDIGRDAAPSLRVTDKGSAARVFGKAHGLSAADEATLGLFSEDERKTWPSLRRGGAKRSSVDKLVREGFLEEVKIEKDPNAGNVRALVSLGDGDPIPKRAFALDAFDAWIRVRTEADSRPPLWTEARVAFTGVPGKVKRLEELGRVRVDVSPRRPRLTPSLDGDREVPLTPAQQVCVDAVVEAMAPDAPQRAFLLEGVTGSGKTEVYLHAARAALGLGRGVLFVVPEIALTPQLFARVASRFDDEEVCVLHSGLSARDRRDALARLRGGHARVALGARSALFAPVPDLGLIIVDEEHDASLKNAGAPPRYHGRDVALWRGQNESAVVVLGSATPSLETRHNVLREKIVGLELPERIGGGGELPEIEVIDLRTRGQMREAKKRDRAISEGAPSAIISGPLADAIDEALENEEQALLFLNRRGYAAFLLCEECGEIAECPSCSVSLTWHKARGEAVCHHCDFTGALPSSCTTCGGAILSLGLGTERVEAEVEARFPGTRIGRLDRDTASRPGAVAKILGQMQRREIDILIGTQMVAKGHDFPALRVVGVILADVALAVPDFRASERTFSLLTQVAGRAGRGQKRGRVFIQTYNPAHPSITYAQTHDVTGFAAQELLLREEALYPPFSRAALFRVEGEDETAAFAMADRVGKILRAAGRARLGSGEWDVLGPAPAPLARLQGKTRVHLFLRADAAGDRAGLCRAVFADADLQAALRRTKCRLILDVDPAHVL